MNSLDKHRENLEHEEWFKAVAKKKQDQVYYLQRMLRLNKIKYNSRKKTISPTQFFTDNKYVLQLQKKHNYTVQTIIV